MNIHIKMLSLLFSWLTMIVHVQALTPPDSPPAPNNPDLPSQPKQLGPPSPPNQPPSSEQQPPMIQQSGAQNQPNVLQPPPNTFQHPSSLQNAPIQRQPNTPPAGTQIQPLHIQQYSYTPNNGYYHPQQIHHPPSGSPPPDSPYYPPPYSHQPVDGPWGLYVFADAIYLERSRSDPINISFLGTTNGLALSARDLQFDNEWGFRAGIGHYIDDKISTELAYFGVSDWGESAMRISPSESLNSFFVQSLTAPRFAVDDFNSATLHAIEYASELHSAEWNFKVSSGSDCNRILSAFVGVRYFRVEETFRFWSVDDIDPFSDVGLYGVHTENDLIGLQVGGSWHARHMEGRLLLSLEGKAGIFRNFNDQSSRIFNNGMLVRSTNADRNNWSTMVEIGAYATYYISDNIQVRGGYMVLFLNGLALAPNQLDYLAGPGGQSHLHNNGNIIYHGPTFGLQIDW